MSHEKNEKEDNYLKIDEIKKGVRYFIENQYYQMDVKLSGPEAKAVILLSHRKKTTEGIFRPTSIHRDEHFGWAVWLLREKGFIPQPPKQTVFELYDTKNNTVLKDTGVYTTEIEAYQSLAPSLFYRALEGEIQFDESEGMKPAIMQLHEMEDWELLKRFGYEVRPVLKTNVDQHRLKTLVTYSMHG